jgi:hypothetical protein
VPGCELEPKPDAEEPRAPAAADPPNDELPPAVDELPEVVPPEAPPLRQEEPKEDDDDDEDCDDDEGDDKDSEGVKSRLERGAPGTARESTNTSPRMCSTLCDGTPDWFTGWVNTTCNPVAVIVSSPPEPEPDVPDAEPVWSLELVVVVDDVVVLPGVPGSGLALVVVVELD